MTRTDEILVAEHDPAVAEMIRRYLAKDGLRVRCARTAEETTAGLAGGHAAAVVLDLTMPGLDARKIRRLIRRTPAGPGRPPVARRGRGQTVVRAAAMTGAAPVICLTAGEGSRAAQGLRPQAIGVTRDACLARPFGPRTLVAAVRAATRGARTPAAEVCAAGPLAADPVARHAARDGVPLDLTGTEFDVLVCLLRSAGRAVSRAALRTAVWGVDGVDSPASASGARIVDVYIAQLRAKLGPQHGIRTVRGIGYVMDTGGLHPGGRQEPSTAPATIGVAGHPTRGDSRTA